MAIGKNYLGCICGVVASLVLFIGALYQTDTGSIRSFLIWILIDVALFIGCCILLLHSERVNIVLSLATDIALLVCSTLMLSWSIGNYLSSLAVQDINNAVSYICTDTSNLVYNMNANSYSSLTDENIIAIEESGNNLAVAKNEDILIIYRDNIPVGTVQKGTALLPVLTSDGKTGRILVISEDNLVYDRNSEFVQQKLTRMKQDCSPNESLPHKIAVALPRNAVMFCINFYGNLPFFNTFHSI